jgi:hypothetical protein
VGRGKCANVSELENTKEDLRLLKDRIRHVECQSF